jgi:hypothetical protein
MPFTCEHCGKEHKTQEELEAEGKEELIEIPKLKLKKKKESSEPILDL